ncbi:MAG: hypothetical protein K8F56_18815 [Rhodocyclaceae bacterium]|nr:hypothetical protein [Rhodocyclaceae bacterium]
MMTGEFPCPFCSEPIKAGAKKCWHCRNFLPADWDSSGNEVIGSSTPRRPASKIRPAAHDRSGVGIGVAVFWMAVLSVLLFFLPLLGPFIAGFVGGRRAGNLANAILAALLPSLILASALLTVTSSIAGIPILGTVAALGSVAVAFAGAGPLLLGAILGGAITPNRTEGTSRLALTVVAIFSALVLLHVVRQIRGAAKNVVELTNYLSSEHRPEATATSHLDIVRSEHRQIWELLVDSLEREDETSFRRLVSTTRFEYNEYGTRSEIGEVASDRGEIVSLSSRVLQRLLERAEFIDPVPTQLGESPSGVEFRLVGEPSGASQIAYTFRREGSDWKLVHVWGG